MQIDIPELSVIALIGTKQREKLTFAKKYFSEEELVNLEGLEDKAVNRLKEGKLTVINVTDLQENTYEAIARLGKKYHCMSVAIIFSAQELANEESFEALIPILEKKGFKKVFLLNSKEEIKTTEVVRVKLENNKRDVHGPFDIIGDIHGCYDELCQLLEKLGYVIHKEQAEVHSPKGRKLVFLGDLVDRGPKSPEVLRMVMQMVQANQAYCVLGNHDGKLLRKLKGSNVKVQHGLETTMEQLEHESEQFIEEVKQFLEELVSHYVFDDGKLVVVHAGLREKLQGRDSKKVRDLAMFGETTGELDEFGLPVRVNWSETYKGSAFVAYGHTPQAKAKKMNNTINIDTGCVFGGKLTAFRYPEREIVDVQAKKVYYEPARPFLT